jgi:acetyltransferase-like isoleucine patch superfamily enzyme
MDVREHTGAWDYSTLPDNVHVGSDCYLEGVESFRRFRSRRDPGLVIGDRVRAYHGTAFTVEPEGYLEVGDDSTLVGAVFWCADRIVLGRRVIVSHHVMLADSDFHPIDPDLRRIDASAIAPGGDLDQRPPINTRPVIIGDDVWIGIGAIILKGAQIGAGARVLAGAVVTGAVPAGAVVAGNPARVIVPDEVAP